jgi:lipoprotein-releasing system permease protein
VIGNIKAISEVVEKPIIVRKSKDIDGFLLRGIDYKADINNFRNNLSTGSFGFSSDSAKEVIISTNTAKTMGLHIGDNIIIYTIDVGQKSSPKTKFAMFKIIGTYSTGLGEYDKTVLISPLKTTRQFFDIEPYNSTRLEIAVKDKSSLATSTEEISHILPFPYTVKNVFDFQRTALIWIQVQKEPVPLVLGIITIVAVLNVVTMLLILIVEKTRQIGVLKVLGMRSADIVRVFLFIGIRLSFKAAFCGASLALIFSIVQQEFGLIKLDSSVYFLDRIPISINPLHYVIVIATTVLITAVVVTIPSIVSSKIKPVKVLRFS